MKHAIITMMLLAGCANSVGQGAKSGPDGKMKGAKELKLDNGEAKDSGIVTYPGGDRIDWKFVEIPAKETGTLDITLTWTTPRPNLQLAFDVWDEYGKGLTKSKASARKKRGPKQKQEIVPDVRGKIFIRVYAVGRGDAGTYKLVVDYKAGTGNIIFDPLSISVSDPPRLPEVPAIIEPCTNDNFDKKKPECRNFCPDPADPKWPPCTGAGKCPVPKDKDNPACWTDKDPANHPDCPTPWDAKYIQHCKPPPCPTPIDPANPNCKPVAQTTRIIKVDINGSDVLVTVPIGKTQGITNAWKARLMTPGGQPLPSGGATIIRVDKSTTVLKVSLTPDVVNANKTVQFDPPP